MNHSLGQSNFIVSRKWKGEFPPKRILAIRLQAQGDVVITLPYLQHLRNNLPASTQIDLLTRKEFSSIPQNLILFNKIFTIGGDRNYYRQLASTWLLLPSLMLQRYDMVLDLQHNILSKIVRKAVRPRAWSLFDRFSSLPAGERTRLTIQAAGFPAAGMDPSFRFKGSNEPLKLLRECGWDESSELVVMNPAAAFPTRNWPLRNYLEFARGWLAHHPNTQFLMVGTSFIQDKAAWLKEKLGRRLINLVGLTTASEAFIILQQARLVLSEDSGLMHMAWVSGVPTIALFGGTRSDWARPLGPHTTFVDASNLSCGGCMKETCKYGDVHCMTRISPGSIICQSLDLLHAVDKQGISLNQKKPALYKNAF